MRPSGEALLYLAVGLAVLGLTVGSSFAYTILEGAAFAGMGQSSASQGIPVFVKFIGNDTYSIYSQKGNIPGTLHLGNATHFDLTPDVCYQATLFVHVHPIDLNLSFSPTLQSNCG